MGSVADEGDLTARANIRNAALRLFAERGHDAVTVREIATAAGVSPALVVHHFGSKDGLRAAVDGYAAQAFDAVFAMDEQDLAEMLDRRQAAASVAESFARAFPHGSPLPAYLRRLLLTNDPAGAALFGRWYAPTRRLLDAMAEMGAARPSRGPGRPCGVPAGQRPRADPAAQPDRRRDRGRPAARRRASTRGPRKPPPSTRRARSWPRPRRSPHEPRPRP